MDLGRVGVWLGTLSLAPAAEEREAVQEIERLGYGSVWIGENHSNREIFAHAATLLGWTERIVVATGIASIWARDASAAANGASALAEFHPGRFILCVGVSHAPIVKRRGQTYGRPLGAMREYLDGMDGVRYMAPPPPEPAPRLIAALAPKMLRLAAERTDGAHPYLVTPEHTAQARELLGPGKLLAPEQGVVLADDPETGRRLARENHLAIYLPMENYVNAWRRLGFGEEDFADGGSDRLVDELVAWGDEAAVAARVRSHLDAGADHVSVQPIGPDPVGQLRRLAPTLLAL
jgi:probable F420-dependent oxidoreductase